MTYEFSCRDLDHVCGWKAKAATEDELVAKMAEHVKKVHDVKTVTDTIVNFAKLEIRRV